MDIFIFSQLSGTLHPWRQRLHQSLECRSAALQLLQERMAIRATQRTGSIVLVWGECEKMEVMENIGELCKSPLQWHFGISSFYRKKKTATLWVGVEVHIFQHYDIELSSLSVRLCAGRLPLTISKTLQQLTCGGLGHPSRVPFGWEMFRLVEIGWKCRGSCGLDKGISGFSKKRPEQNIGLMSVCMCICVCI